MSSSDASANQINFKILEVVEGFKTKIKEGDYLKICELMKEKHKLSTLMYELKIIVPYFHWGQCPCKGRDEPPCCMATPELDIYDKIFTIQMKLKEEDATWIKERLVQNGRCWFKFCGIRGIGWFDGHNCSDRSDMKKKFNEHFIFEMIKNLRQPGRKKMLKHNQLVADTLKCNIIRIKKL